jgi:alkanesulfonate monooxygenase SsuD/methylene tetrahydromethanopterin reductase-like flavin-dependent oxidoreductase (luciferase family)
VRFLQTVACNSFRNPALLAKIVASLDVISDGRVELGLGAGWLAREYEAYGYDFPPMPVRLAQLGEALRLVKLLDGRSRRLRGRALSASQRGVRAAAGAATAAADRRRRRWGRPARHRGRGGRRREHRPPPRTARPTATPSAVSRRSAFAGRRRVSARSPRRRGARPPT